MKPAASHIAQLYYRAQADLLTDAERLEWEAFVAEYPGDIAYLERLGEGGVMGTEFVLRSPQAEQERAATMYADITAKLEFTVRRASRVHRVHFLRTAWFRYAAAILLLIGSGTVIYLWNINKKKADIVSEKPVPAENILPGGNKALLTLADGRRIVLDSAANGELAIEQGSRVYKDAEGRVRYDAGQQGINGAAISFNTMSTPKGGQYQLALPDGSKVWLNAASSITYPVVFTGRTRQVKINGEAYFEIAKNAQQPFIVDINGKSNVEVLGTAFNINAYGDEPVIKTTLINGSVKINNKILQPGQADVNGRIITTNVEQDIAWKNGVFNFSNLSLEEVMRQLGRWYDLTIVYEKNIPNVHLKGEIGRNLSLSQVLKVLEATMEVKFRLAPGRQLIVSP